MILQGEDFTVCSEAEIPKVDFEPRLGLLKLWHALLEESVKVNRRSSKALFWPTHRVGGCAGGGLHGVL